MAASYLPRHPNLPLGGRPTKSGEIQAIRKRGVQIFARTPGLGLNPPDGVEIGSPRGFCLELFGYLAWLSVGVPGYSRVPWQGLALLPLHSPLQPAS